MAMTAAQLKENVQDITEMTFTTTQLNMFIKQAEQKIYGFIKDLPLLRKTTTLTHTVRYGISLPADCLYIHSITYNNDAASTGRKAIVQKSFDFLLEAYPSTSEAVPEGVAYPEIKYYAIDSTTGVSQNSKMQVAFAPKWDQSMTFNVEYQYQPNSIVDPGQTDVDGTPTDNDQPWLGTNYDSALLNGTLVEAARFMKAEPDIIALYDQQYSLAMQQLMDAVGRLGSDSFRPKPPPAQPLTIPAPAQPPQREG